MQAVTKLWYFQPMYLQQMISGPENKERATLQPAGACITECCSKLC